MGIGEVAALIAAIAFAVMAGFIIYPLIRLGKLFDQLSLTVKQQGEHALPVLDESVTTVQQVNETLKDVNRVSAAASASATNIAALTDLYGSFLGKPVIKIVSAVYALRSTAQSFLKGGGVRYEAAPQAPQTSQTPQPAPASMPAQASTMSATYAAAPQATSQTVSQTASMRRARMPRVNRKREVR